MGNSSHRDSGEPAVRDRRDQSAVVLGLSSGVLFSLQASALAEFDTDEFIFALGFHAFMALAFLFVLLWIWIDKGSLPVSTGRWVFGLIFTAMPFPWWLSKPGLGFLRPVFHGHPAVLSAFLLMGGSIHMEGALLTVFHLIITLTCVIYDIAKSECLVDEISLGFSCTQLHVQFLIVVVAVDSLCHITLLILSKKLQHEIMVADVLVSNCLPEAVSVDLKQQISDAVTEAASHRSQKVVKDHLREQPALIGFYVQSQVGIHEGVSVLFADIVHFTHASGTVSPHALVTVLRDVFKELDWLCISMNIEKIKTVGDAYMACGNLSRGPSSKAAIYQGAHAALQLGRSICELQGFRIGSEPVQFRVGIHTGPLVSGVIGLTKFSFDVWGDTVNIASRMETCGLAGRVQVSSETYTIINSPSLFSHSRSISVKGKSNLVAHVLDTVQIGNAEFAHSSGGTNTPTSSRSSQSTGGGRDTWCQKTDMHRSSDVSSSIASTSSINSPSAKRSFMNNPLVVGPTFFHRLSNASSLQSGQSSSNLLVSSSPVMISRDPLERSQRQSLSPVVFSNEKKKEKTAEKAKQKLECRVSFGASLADDFTPMMSPRMPRMQNSDVEGWLLSNSLVSFIEVFKEHNWDSLRTVSSLQSEDLDLMNITTAGHRRAILTAVSELRDYLCANPNAMTETREDLIVSFPEPETAVTLLSVSSDNNTSRSPDSRKQWSEGTGNLNV